MLSECLPWTVGSDAKGGQVGEHAAMLVSRLGQVDGWLDLSSAIGSQDLSFSFADLGKRVVSEYLEGTGKRLVGGQRQRLSRGA